MRGCGNLIKFIQRNWILFLFLLPFSLSAQNVAMMGDQAITTAEFVWVFKKNNLKRAKPDQSQISDYLQRYIDFRLKVLDALSLGLDKDTAYVREVEAFEKILRTRLRSKSKQEVEFVLNEYRSGVLMFNVSERKIWAPGYGDQATTVEQTEQRERDWVAELRKRFPVRVNEVELGRLSSQKW
ncbi:MAG: hypothetical protein EOO02_17750 [Chitinophagaceae bacterium]|nr:MAG: hypothetical protein EOO02_17750 [Chitinophagaceae bacterium]